MTVTACWYVRCGSRNFAVSMMITVTACRITVTACCHDGYGVRIFSVTVTVVTVSPLARYDVCQH